MRIQRRPMMLVAQLLLILVVLLCGAHRANARVSVDLHLGDFPELVPVPGYPVYYAPRIAANFFFYDGAYWLFEDDNWFVSDWYDGPWELVDPYSVPAFVLRVPVRYYRVPPPLFRSWYYDAPPRWGHYWGPHWSQRRHGWDQWDRHHAPRPAPLPYYQRHYRGDRYPHAHRQHELHRKHYRYQAEHRHQQRPSPPRHHDASHRQPEPYQRYRESWDHRQVKDRDRQQHDRREQYRHAPPPGRAPPGFRDRSERERADHREQHKHRQTEFQYRERPRPDHRQYPEQRRQSEQGKHQEQRRHQEQRKHQEQRPHSVGDRGKWQAQGERSKPQRSADQGGKWQR